MIYILENEVLKVKISSMGAELQSIRRLEDDTEYLWQGDARYWPGRATNLFPMCGRMVEGKYTFEGKTYEIPIHGFAKLQEWTVLRQRRMPLPCSCRIQRRPAPCIPSGLRWRSPILWRGRAFRWR